MQSEDKPRRENVQASNALREYLANKAANPEAAEAERLMHQRIRDTQVALGIIDACAAIVEMEKSIKKIADRIDLIATRMRP
jgi:hypothetical protein